MYRMGVERSDLYERIVDIVVKLRSFYPDGKLREQKITQEELATLVGVPRTTITNIENRRQLTAFHLFYDICLALNVEARDMLPSMEELGQKLNGTDRDKIVVSGTDLQSEFEEDVVTMVRIAWKEAEEKRYGDESTGRKS